jgi:choline dehydrogenase-like flavoprotein
MYVESSDLETVERLGRFDLCIAGAGAAGLAMAHRLAGSSLKVLVLASGLPTDRGLPPGSRQKVYGGTLGPFLANVDPLFLRRSRLNMYGGTTNHFGFWARPLDEADFLPRQGYRTAAWPIPRASLDPWYAEANAYGRFGPFNYYDLAFWESVLGGAGFPRKTEDRLARAVFHAQYADTVRQFQVQLGEALRASANVTVLFNAHLLSIEGGGTGGTGGIGDAGHVRRFVCASLREGRADRRFHVEADRFVLAMGGIETVRKLKLSGDLGNNRNDHLGRGFMVHPLLTTAAEVRFATPLPLETRNFFRDQQIRLRTEGDAFIHDSAPLVNPELMAKYEVFNAWGVLVPTAATMAEERIGNFRAILGFDPAGDRAEINLNWEQVPNRESVIGLDHAVVDPVFGQPVAHVQWQLRDEDKRTAVKALDLVRDHLERNGSTSFRILSDLSGGPEHWAFGREETALATGDHHMGSLRMSVSPDDGIVDTDCRFHQIDNLYAAGSAVFPTSGYANPTLTIVALALRLADHLVEGVAHRG